MTCSQKITYLSIKTTPIKHDVQDLQEGQISIGLSYLDVIVHGMAWLLAWCVYSRAR
jgi:hypothetical protein